MIVSIHQPAYLPWLGYLHQIALSDVFIFLDTVQFEKNSFTNRNRIKSPSGPIWLTVPVLLQQHMDKAVLDLKVDNRQPWRKKHLRSIEQNYRKAPMFSERFPKLVELYEHEDDSLAELCYRQLQFWMVEFGLTTRVLRASSLAVAGRKSELVLALCKAVGGDTYLSGPQGRGYLNEESFAAAGVFLQYRSFDPKPYPQRYGEFLPAMAALDYWLNVADVESFASLAASRSPEAIPIAPERCG